MRVLIQDNTGYTVFSYETDTVRNEQNVCPAKPDIGRCQMALLSSMQLLNLMWMSGMEDEERADVRADTNLKKKVDAVTDDAWLKKVYPSAEETDKSNKEFEQRLVPRHVHKDIRS